jgi:hypothetical protein
VDLCRADGCVSVGKHRRRDRARRAGCARNGVSFFVLFFFFFFFVFFFFFFFFFLPALFSVFLVIFFRLFAGRIFFDLFISLRFNISPSVHSSFFMLCCGYVLFVFFGAFLAFWGGILALGGAFWLFFTGFFFFRL